MRRVLVKYCKLHHPERARLVSGGSKRTWAVLENHWNGSILDEIQTAINCAESMKWNGNQPIVKLITETYQTVVLRRLKVLHGIYTSLWRVQSGVM